MQSTIRHERTEAVVSYEEKARDQWLFDPPAQVLLHIRITQCVLLMIHVVKLLHVL